MRMELMNGVREMTSMSKAKKKNPPPPKNVYPNKPR